MFAFVLPRNLEVLLYSLVLHCHAINCSCLVLKSAVTAVCLCPVVSMPLFDAEEDSAAQRQTKVTAY